MSGSGNLLKTVALGGAALNPAVAATGLMSSDYFAKKQQERDRRKILNQAFDDQNSAMDQTTSMINAEGQSLQGDARQKALNDQEAANFAQAQKDLSSAGAGGNLIGSVGDGGNVSSDFIKAKADSALNEGNRLTALAREVAKVRAPGMMSADEKMRQSDLMGRTGSMWGSNKRISNAAMMDAENVQEPAYGPLGKIARQAAMLAFLA